VRGATVGLYKTITHTGVRSSNDRAGSSRHTTCHVPKFTGEYIVGMYYR
jgi:hypothetical protein